MWEILKRIRNEDYNLVTLWHRQYIKIRSTAGEIIGKLTVKGGKCRCLIRYYPGMIKTTKTAVVTAGFRDDESRTTHRPSKRSERN